MANKTKRPKSPPKGVDPLAWKYGQRGGLANVAKYGVDGPNGMRERGKKGAIAKKSKKKVGK